MPIHICIMSTYMYQHIGLIVLTLKLQKYRKERGWNRKKNFWREFPKLLNSSCWIDMKQDEPAHGPLLHMNECWAWWERQANPERSEGTTLGGIMIGGVMTSWQIHVQSYAGHHSGKHLHGEEHRPGPSLGYLKDSVPNKVLSLRFQRWLPPGKPVP